MAAGEGRGPAWIEVIDQQVTERPEYRKTAQHEVGLGAGADDRNRCGIGAGERMSAQRR